MEEKIDFVITWVDGNDVEWQKQKNIYSGNKSDESNSIIRYRDWGLLKYWFRSIEKYTPWVNKIYFVTCGQKPEWLNCDNPKLVLVNHSDFMPKETLPTFNSSSILMYLHKIKGLSEKFVVFNDDMYITSPIEPTYFFDSGLPKDALVFNAVSSEKDNNIINHIILNDLELIATKIDKREFIKHNKNKVYNIKYGKSLVRTLLLKPWRYYTGIYNQHVPLPYLKSSFEEFWKLFETELNKTTLNKFRTKYDYNEWAVRYWQLLNGKFIPKGYNKDAYYSLQGDNSKFLTDVVNEKYKTICINDNDESLDFEKVKEQLIYYFDKKLNTKCSFEK